METIEFTVDGKTIVAEETEGMFSIVQDSIFIGQMYREKSGWSWETAEEVEENFPWIEVGEKIDTHLQNLN